MDVVINANSNKQLNEELNNNAAVTDAKLLAVLGAVSGYIKTHPRSVRSDSEVAGRALEATVDSICAAFRVKVHNALHTNDVCDLVTNAVAALRSTNAAAAAPKT